MSDVRKGRCPVVTKAEVIERIIDRSTDEWTDNPEDFMYSLEWTLEGAAEWIKEARREDILNDFEEELCMPAEATPELVMEAMNCYRTYMQKLATNLEEVEAMFS